jgi:hypothetical protein
LEPFIPVENSAKFKNIFLKVNDSVASMISVSKSNRFIEHGILAGLVEILVETLNLALFAPDVGLFPVLSKTLPHLPGGTEDRAEKHYMMANDVFQAPLLLGEVSYFHVRIPLYYYILTTSSVWM